MANDDQRILLTPDNIHMYNSHDNPNCDEDFNLDVPNQLVPYSNAAKGIAFDVPYNSQWGSENYKISPYDEVEDKVSFGSIHVFEACSWLRGYTLQFIPQRSAQEAIKEIKETVDPILLVVPPTVVTINGLTVIKYAEHGLCPSYPTLEIVGAKYNYVFTPLCGSDVDAGFTFLENIVKSVKLI